MGKLRLFTALLTLSTPFFVPANQAGEALCSAVVRRASGGVKSDSTSIESNLSELGIDPVNSLLYPKDDTRGGALELVSLYEWGYTRSEPSSNYGLYLILYNPSETKYLSDRALATVGVATGEMPTDGGNYAPDVNQYYSFHMVEVDRTSNNRFIKFFIPDQAQDGTSLHSLVSTDMRRYVVGSVTLFTGSGSSSGKSSSIGRELDCSGFAKDLDSTSIDESTLDQDIADTFVVRVEATPFTSSLGSFQTDTYIGNTYGGAVTERHKNKVGARSTVQAYSTLFSVPSELRDFGDLVSVRVDYYKYRTNWLLMTDKENLYQEWSPYAGRSTSTDDGGQVVDADGFLGSTGLNYSADSMPSYGFRFQPIFDLDDRSAVDESDSLNAFSSRWEKGNGILTCDYLGIDRFYNNQANGVSHYNLRIPSFAYVEYTDQSLDNQTFSGKEILETIEENGTRYGTSISLPRKNGYLNPNSVYIPSYSEDEEFFRYGYNNNVISVDDLLTVVPDVVGKYLDQRYALNFTGNGPISGEGFAENQYGVNTYDSPDDFWAFYWQTKNFTSEQYHSNGSFMFENALRTAEDTTAYNHLYGEAGENDHLLSGILNDDGNDPTVTDYILSTADDSYSSDIQTFLQDNANRDVYRITYEFGLSNSYRGLTGKSTELDAGRFAGAGSPERWTYRMGDVNRDVEVAKTDAIFDFQFLDLICDDGVEKHVISASSDPLSVVGSPTTSDGSDDPDRLIQILFLVLAGIVLLVVISVLSKFFPIIGTVLKYCIQGLLTIVQVVLWIPYILIIYPIGKMAKKDMRVWPFGKDSK